MFPIIHVLGMPIPMYAFMVGMGILAFILYYKLWVEKREKIDRITSNRLLFVSILGFGVLVGSAFLFNSVFHSIKTGKPSFGGVTWLGGVLGLIPLMYLLIHIFVPKDRGNAINRFSTLFPGVVIAHALGRVGCFFGGCCYGGPTDSFLGVSFPAGSLAGKSYPDLTSTATKTVEHVTANGETIIETLYPSLPVLPTQLIEAVFEILLFAVMLLLYRRVKKYNIEIYAFAYGAFRFLMEFYRGDDRGTTGFSLTPSQLMCMMLWVGAVLLILFRNGLILKKTAAKCANWRVVAEHSPAGNPRLVLTDDPQYTTNVIRELNKLKEEGILTEEEFERKKTEILRRL